MKRLLLIALHIFLGLGAVGAGRTLVVNPSGEKLTFKADWLKESPFRDYRVPGLFLAVIIGSVNLASASAQWRRARVAPLLSLATGLLLLVWLIIQTAIIGFRHPSQLIWAVLFPVVALLGAAQLKKRDA